MRAESFRFIGELTEGYGPGDSLSESSEELLPWDNGEVSIYVDQL